MRSVPIGSDRLLMACLIFHPLVQTTDMGIPNPYSWIDSHSISSRMYCVCSERHYNWRGGCLSSY